MPASPGVLPGQRSTTIGSDAEAGTPPSVPASSEAARTIRRMARGPPGVLESAQGFSQGAAPASTAGSARDGRAGPLLAEQVADLLQELLVLRQRRDGLLL